jgi:primosomal protein N' (replication factor Y)
MYCLVCPFSKTFDEVWVTYKVPDLLTSELKIWQIVNISFQNKDKLAIVIDISKTLDIDFDEWKIKEINSIKNNFLFLSNYRIELIKWIAKYYYTAIHNSFSLFIPKNLKEKIIKDKFKIETKNDFKYFFNYNNKLSISQKKAYNKINESVNNKILLYWLTWSWKTEIYINLIKNNLDKNKQSLFLIPEIILTNQLSDKIKNIFWEAVLILNSTITEASKTKSWLDINNNNAKIIIGTRSALFYPYNNLWLIIIDEEHDDSYISDSSPRYNTIEVAEKITELNWNKLILWSGTPSINTMYKWVKWEYQLINILNKYNKRED